MNVVARYCIAIVLAAAGLGAAAQTTADLAGLRVRSLAAGCAPCHGTDGRAAPDAVVAGLAGRSPSELSARLRAFRNGTLAGSVMPQLAKGYSDAQIDQLAAYFAAQSKGAP